jgi:DNA-binding HxlR family transcriptional regulator/putative sterol carrier protein
MYFFMRSTGYAPDVRSYGHFCPAARALDVVGERWSLLVVRELLFGPKRYTDLQEGLSTIGPNVLAERLRTLEAAGVVRKARLPAPAASTVYELTARGAGLRPAVMALFEWGLQLTDEPAPGDAVRASYWLPAIEAAARRQPIAAEVDDVYEFRVGDDVIAVVVRTGGVTVRRGAVESPDLVVCTDDETFAQLGARRLTPDDAIAAGRLSVDGDPAAGERCAALFALR